jgi:hypothetical protein
MSPLFFAASSCWLGVGLLVLGAPRSVRQGASVVPVRARLQRAAGLAALVVGVVPLGAELGCALALVTCLLASMATASLAVLLLPLWPRFYLASVCSSAALAVAAALL